MRSSGIGGQAVIEGVMMKNKDRYAVAVRKPDKEIVVDIQEYKSKSEKYPILKIPVIRGVAAFAESMSIGIKTLTYSAGFFEDETDSKGKDKKVSEKKEKAIMTATVCLSVILAIGIFVLVPYFASRFLSSVIQSETLLAVCEGAIRLVLFIGYVVSISFMKDIRRVFMYHGAEHKCINCIEHGLKLNLKNVKRQSKQHKRCGTSFLLFVVLLSIIFFVFIRVRTAWLRVIVRVLLIPVIAGVAYEFIRLAGRSESPVINVLSKPGLWLQGLTTREPDNDMIEVAIASVEAIFDWRAFLEEENKAVKETGCTTDRAVKTDRNQKRVRTDGRNDKKVTSDKDTAKVVKSGESSADELFVSKTAADKVSGDRVTTDKETADKASGDKMTTDKTVADKAFGDKVTTDKTAADKASGDKVTTDKAATDKASSEDENNRISEERRRRSIRNYGEPVRSNRVRKSPVEWPTVDIQDDEDDEILRKLDQFFDGSKSKSE